MCNTKELQVLPSSVGDIILANVRTNIFMDEAHVLVDGGEEQVTHLKRLHGFFIDKNTGK